MDTSKLQPLKTAKSYAPSVLGILFRIFGNFKYSNMTKLGKSYMNLWRSSLKYWMTKRCLMIKVSRISRQSPILWGKYATIRHRSRLNRKKKWCLCWKMNSLHSIWDKQEPISQNNPLSILKRIAELTLSSRSKKSKRRHFNTTIKRRYTAVLKNDNKYRNFYHQTIFQISMLAKKTMNWKKDTNLCIPNRWTYP